MGEGEGLGLGVPAPLGEALGVKEALGVPVGVDGCMKDALPLGVPRGAELAVAAALAVSDSVVLVLAERDCRVEGEPEGADDGVCAAHRAHRRRRRMPAFRLPCKWAD